jgi:hypothetical protein
MLLRTIGKPFLCAAFGLFALLFESLHFFLTLLVRNGHQVSFATDCSLAKAKRFVGGYQRGSRG